MMKKMPYTLAIILLTVLALSAQEGNNFGSRKTETTYAVPDLPAFKALDVEPSNLLRVSDVRTLATNISSFIEGGKFTLPQGFAIELSPGALIYRDKIIGLNDYKKQNVNLAYNTGISIGTKVDATTGLNKLAIGWRTTFINKADKFIDPAYRNKIHTILTADAVALNQSWRAFTIKHKSEFKATVDGLTFTAAEKTTDSVMVRLWQAETTATESTAAEIAALDKAYELSHWNANRLDAAAALVMIAEDANGKNLQADKIQAWLTGALKLRKNGQLLIGVQGNAGFQDTKKDEAGHIISRPEYQLTTSMRCYAGVNKYKFFTELAVGVKQTEHIKMHQTNYFSIGGEIGIYNLVWVNLYGGMQDVGLKNGTKKSLTTGFFKIDWKLTIPDWVKFRT